MTSSDTASQIAYLARVLKAPALRDSAERLAAAARDGGWTHQEYLAACLEAEVATRSAHGAANRIRAAGFPARKTIEDFEFDAQPVRPPAADRRCGLSAGSLPEARNVVLLDPPEPENPSSRSHSGITAARHGHRVLFATATDWVTRLTDAHRHGRLQAEITRLGRYPLLDHRRDRLHPVRARGRQPVLPAHLRPLRDRQRHRHQQQTILRTWGEIFGDDAVAVAMVDRLIHHAELISLKGDSYRLKDRDLGRIPRPATDRRTTAVTSSPTSRRAAATTPTT